MANIRQLTNFSSEVTSATITSLKVYIGNKEWKYDVPYYVLTAEIMTGLSNTPINKLGYVCEPKGFDYPIVIKTGNENRTIYIGKTGMFETMPEIFLDANDDEAKELECTPKITEVWVPKDITFKLDYMYGYIE